MLRVKKWPDSNCSYKKWQDIPQAYLWKDLFTSLVDAPWWRILVFGAFLYIFLWNLFALLYWNFNNESVIGCNKSMLVTFTDAFLLSIDSQTTIGFGNYAVESDCYPGIFILVLQVWSCGLNHQDITHLFRNLGIDECALECCSASCRPLLMLPLWA